MEFFEVIQKRRSVRRFKPEPFPNELVQKALEAAILAPNSSNTQTWDFHWIKSSNMKRKVVFACLNQSAARTASQLVVITATGKNWKRSQPGLVQWVKSMNSPKEVLLYYEKLIPISYRWGFLNSLAPLKFLLSFAIGLFRPMTRGPFTKRDIQEVAVKSAALAAENFVLAITALGGATCMMEGFDRWRLRRALGLPWSTRVVMVVGIGYQDDKGIWGPQYRLPISEVVHTH